MITLEGVTKYFAGSATPAVDRLTLDVASGEVCVLIGSSGCGKSTTLKMINRLIEPSAGRILVDGADTARIDPLDLRRGMGYVIQEVGLFPHMTIAENIATVPRELAWPAERTRHRVDELLSLVGLEPSQYRDRLPASLSGGQRQRVGVARALAADPPVLLMDEPFGAVDPITRVHLQNEFLRLQARMRKTVLFVTHDMDEAMKLADRIAILHQGRLVQHAPPRTILGAPTDAFIASLMGEDQALKRLRFVRVEEIVRPAPAVAAGAALSEARAALSETRNSRLYVVDATRRPIGSLSRECLARPECDGTVDELMRPLEEPLTAQTSTFEALCRILRDRTSALPVVSDSGVFLGEVDLDRIICGENQRG